jgi:cytochrome c biogenesis protein CcdA/glutaredoxin
MKKIILGLLIMVAITLGAPVPANAQAESKIYFFYGIGCPHCAAVEKYFDDNKLFDKYLIDKREIYFNRDNALLFNSVMDRLNIPMDARGIPAIILGNKVITGDTPIIENFTAYADKFLAQTPAPEQTPTPMPKAAVSESKDTVGSLTLLAIIAGASVDAINPCAFAVLIILVTTILATGKAKRALAAGLTFSTSVFISYFLMGLGLYKALAIGNSSHIFYKLVGWLAIILGLFNLKDYFWYGKGFLMEVPRSWRPALKNLLNSVTSPAGAFTVGFLVSLFLLPCTSGPYIVILGMLAKKVQLFKTVLYLLLYNLIFVAPMILISMAVYKGFDPTKAEEIRQKRLRLLHLIAGLVMLAMGISALAGWI